MQRIRTTIRFLDIDIQVRGFVLGPITRLRMCCVFQADREEASLSHTLPRIPGGRSSLHLASWSSTGHERLVCLTLEAHCASSGIMRHESETWIRALWEAYLQVLTLAREPERRLSQEDRRGTRAVHHFAAELSDLTVQPMIRRDGYTFDADARRLWLIESLGRTRRPDAIRPILSVFQDTRNFGENRHIFHAAIHAIKEIGSPQAIGDLFELWGYIIACAPPRMSPLTTSIRKAIADLGGSATVDLFTALFGPEPPVLHRGLRSAHVLKPALVHMLRARAELAVTAAWVLGNLGERRVLPSLRRLRQRVSGAQRATVDAVIESLTTIDTLPVPTHVHLRGSTAQLPRSSPSGRVSSRDLPRPTSKR